MDMTCWEWASGITEDNPAYPAFLKHSRTIFQDEFKKERCTCQLETLSATYYCTGAAHHGALHRAYGSPDFGNKLYAVWG